MRKGDRIVPNILTGEVMTHGNVLGLLVGHGVLADGNGTLVVVEDWQWLTG